MSKRTNSLTSLPERAEKAPVSELSLEGPLLVAGKVLRRTRRDIPRGEETLILVTYEIQGFNGEVARVTQVGVEDCLEPGAEVVVPVYVSVYAGKSGPAWTLRRKQVSGVEF